MRSLDTRTRMLRVGFICGCLSLPISAAAIGADAVPQGWPGLVSALEQADPELVAARGEVESQRALVDQARVRSNPELELELSDLALREGEDPVDPRVRVAWSIEQPPPGLIGRRIALAEFEVRCAEAELGMIRQERLAALLPQWIEVSRLSDALSLATDSTARLHENVELTRQLVNEGETAGTDLRRLEVEAGLAASSRASLERELTTTRGLVALQLGLAPDNLEVALLRELFPPNSALDLTTWQSLARTHRPELLRDRAELDRLTLQQQVADAEGRSSLAYSVFVESTEAETTAGAGLTIPLKQSGNGTRATQQSIARRHEALTEALQLRETQVTAEIAVHFAAVEAALAQVAELEAVVVPAADAALATALLAWREGEGSLLNYLDAQRQRISINESLLDGQVDLANARGELMLAAGLTTWPEEPTR